MKKSQKPDKFLFVCHGKDCLKKGAKSLHKQLKHELKKTKGKKNIQVLKCKCLDRCKFAPSLVFGHQWFGQVKRDEIDQILQSEAIDQA